MTVKTLTGIVPVRPRRSLRETVMSQIRSAIVAGDMRPGEVYSAPMLANQFGVSATPVREAMLDLLGEELVVVVPNKGFRVTQVSEKKLAEVTAVRLLLEPPAAAAATAIIPDDDIPVLRAKAEEIVVAAVAKDLSSYLDADRDFHLSLLGYTGNDTLLDEVAKLRSQTRQFGLKKLLEKGELPANAQEHTAIVDALADRDAAVVQRLMQTHIRHTLGIWAGRDEVGEFGDALLAGVPAPTTDDETRQR